MLFLLFFFLGPAGAPSSTCASASGFSPASSNGSSCCGRASGSSLLAFRFIFYIAQTEVQEATSGAARGYTWRSKELMVCREGVRASRLHERVGGKKIVEEKSWRGHSAPSPHLQRRPLRRPGGATDHLQDSFDDGGFRRHVRLPLHAPCTCCIAGSLIRYGPLPGYCQVLCMLPIQGLARLYPLTPIVRPRT